MAKRGLGREEDHGAAFADAYPHPFISCLMPGIAVLTVVAALLLAFHVWQSSLPPDTTVPNVEGLKTNQACTDLKQAGLNVEVVKEQQPSEKVPADCVLSSEPASGRKIKTGRIVRLVISSGTIYTLVPDVRELPQAVAIRRLQAASLSVPQAEDRYHNTIPIDRVISSTPKEGSRVEKLTAVKLVISRGPRVKSPQLDLTATKSTVITAIMPTDDEPSAPVRIDVSDSDGQRTVFQKDAKAGESVTQNVQGQGNITVKVYYGDRVVLTRTF